MSAGDKNKFDDLFKKGLDAPEDRFEFNEADWDDMETQLPGEKKKSKVFPLRRLAIAASVLIALALGWWLLGTDKGAEQQVANVKRETGNNDSLTIKKEIPMRVATDIGNEKNRTAEQLAAGGSTDRTKTRKDPSPIKKAGSVKRKGVEAVTIKNDQLIAQNAPQVNDVEQQKDSSVIAQGLIGSPIASAGNTQQAASAGGNDQANVTDAANEIQKDAVLLSPKKEQQKMSDKSGPVLAVSVILSPNFNGVGSLSGSKMGKTAGLLFSVGVGNKLTIGTGAVYHQVPYTTAYSNYISTYKFATAPVSVMADCRVLDIPINVDYNVYRRGTNSFNLGAGLSSYFMLKETYNYEFAPGHAYGPTSFTVNGQNRHLFGVFDVSATYQRKINNKLSLGLQPYLKLPLTDIGNNRVRLQTAGVALAISWTIINKNP